MTPTDTLRTELPAAPQHGWRWAPAWVLTFVALWPAPGYAEAVMVLGALAALLHLVLVRFRGGTRLLSGPAWALTSVLFFAYWSPQLLSSIDAVDVKRALRESLVDLRYLPFLWLVASAVANETGRRKTFNGLAIIVGIWTLDALLQAVTGTSPLFWLLDSAKMLMSGRSMCAVDEIPANGRITGILGPCNLKIGLVLASLSPFLLFVAERRFRTWGWVICAAALGIVILLAGARAAWLTFALVLAFSGWRLLGWRRLMLVFAFGVATLGALTAASTHVRERVTRTAHILSAENAGVDMALSGRVRIWNAAICMVQESPFNGVGVRGFRAAFDACDPHPDEQAAWGEGPALHAHQIVLEIASETGIFGLLIWLAGLAMAWRAWRYADNEARLRAQPAMLALAVTVFPLNTHLAFYSTFWGGLTLLLAALYAGSLLGGDASAPVSELPG